MQIAFASTNQPVENPIEFSSNITDTTHCISITFFTSTLGEVYEWDFGIHAQPSVITGKGPHEVSFLTPGVYDITLTVDGQSATQTQMINIGNNSYYSLDLELMMNDEIYCKGDMVPVYYDFEPAPLSTEDWTFIWYINAKEVTRENNLLSDTLTNQSKIQLKVIPNSPCYLKDTLFSSIINPSIQDTLLPKVFIFATSNPVCIGDTINFSSSVLDTDEITWFLNHQAVGNNNHFTLDNFEHGDLVYAEISVQEHCIVQNTVLSDTISANYFNATTQLYTPGSTTLKAGFEPFYIVLSDYFDYDEYLTPTFDILYTKDIVNAHILKDTLWITDGAQIGLDSLKIQMHTSCDSLIIWLVYKISDELTDAKNISDLEVNVFPNPFDEIVNISWNKLNSPLNLSVYTLTGKVIKHEILYPKSNQHQLNLHQITSGVYYLKLQHNQSVEVFKLVKR